MFRIIAYLVLVLLLGAQIFGCTSDKLEGPGKENQAPTVWLSSAPPEGTVSAYMLHLYWGGWDPDGEVDYYEYVITDNMGGVFNPADTTGADKWERVYRNDSTFTFTADELGDSVGTDWGDLLPVDFIRSHTFFIRSVDDQLLASKKPAYRSFTARTLSPTVDILVPTRSGQNPAQVPPITTFKWIGKDYVNNLRETQEPDSVRTILLSTANFDDSWAMTVAYIRTSPDAPEWTDWRYYKAPADSGRFWTTPPLEYGAYIFAVQVKDEAGAVNPVFDEDRNVRRILVSERNNGPVLTVFNKYIGTMRTSQPDAPLQIIDLPAKVPMTFKFWADARSYGGVASGFRYGWDIQDLSDPEQWEISYTPFTTDDNSAESPPRTFEFDSHTFHVEVIDNSGYTSQIGVRVNIVPFTMRKNLLFVDDWVENSGGFAMTNGTVPSDAEHDAFWIEMLDSLDGFDPSVDMIEVDDELAINTLADYRSVVWNATVAYNGTSASLINDIIRFVDPDIPQTGGKTSPNVLALFMAAGGHVLLTGQQVMCAAINRISFAPAAPAYPIIFRYELTGDQDQNGYQDSRIGQWGVGEQSFAYIECCLNVLDINYIRVGSSIRRTQVNICPVMNVRTRDQRTDGLRFTIPLPGKWPFPALSLRPEVGGPGKWFSEDRSGLNGDVYNPPYFASVAKGGDQQGSCNDLAELEPPRDCIEPIYGNGCLNTSSKIYGAPVAFWTKTYENRVPDAGGVAARSAVWGFHPVYFNPSEVKSAINIVLFDEWQLPRK